MREKKNRVHLCDAPGFVFYKKCASCSLRIVQRGSLSLGCIALAVMNAPAGMSRLRVLPLAMWKGRGLSGATGSAGRMRYSMFLLWSLPI